MIAIEPDAEKESCARMAAGESVPYSFTASAPVDFNIHYHEGNDVVYPIDEKQITEHSGIFAAPADQVYCMMWENKGAETVTLSPGAPPE